MFADAVIGRDNQVIQVLQQPTKSFPTLKFRLGTDVTVENVKLWYTTDAKPTPQASWDSRVVTLEEGADSVNLVYPDDATYAYVSFTYNLNLTMSTSLIKLV